MPVTNEYPHPLRITVFHVLRTSLVAIIFRLDYNVTQPKYKLKMLMMMDYLILHST
jgi:hypothetical protein